MIFFFSLVSSENFVVPKGSFADIDHLLSSPSNLHRMLVDKLAFYCILTAVIKLHFCVVALFLLVDFTTTACGSLNHIHLKIFKFFCFFFLIFRKVLHVRLEINFALAANNGRTNFPREPQ